MLLAERLAENPALRGEAFNFSNELQMTVLELVQEILRRMGSALTPEIRCEASNEIRHQYLSAEKARRVLGWRPLFTLDEGLERTIAWYREFFTREQSS
jgi:CDP-glucose 4,6-dehydratase